MKNDEKEYNFEFSEILFLKNHPNMRKIEGERFLQRSLKVECAVLKIIVQ